MTRLNNDAVLLFTGGGKGITAQCAVSLSTVLPCTYILMGRSELGELPSWLGESQTEQEIKQEILEDAKKNDEKLTPREIESAYRKLSGNREIEQTINKILDHGAKVHYVAADVTDVKSVREAVVGIEKVTGPITGLVHGAGRLADKRIERKTESDFEAVYGTKVDGLKAVLSCLDQGNLDLLVLFSSVAGAFGNVGQADYAMANEYLSKFAFQFQDQHPDCFTLAINWGPWDSGMVTPGLREAFSQMGISLISMEEGTQQFVDEVMAYQHSTPQVVFGSKIERPVKITFPEQLIAVKRVIAPDDSPFLLDHQIGPNRVLPATCAAAWMAETCEGLFPSYHFFILKDYQVLKGLVFPDNSPQEFITKVKFVSQENDGAVDFDVAVTSLQNDREIIHYRAGITMHQSVPEGPVRADLLAKGNLPTVTDGKDLYEEKVLFHGPAFRGLKSVLRITEDEVTTICHLPSVSQEIQGQFPVSATNPYANDVVLQGILAWSYENHQKVCLPAGIEHLVQYERLPFDQDVFVDVKIVSFTRTRAKADAVIFNEQGKVLIDAKGIEGIMSRALHGLFKTSKTSLDV